MSIGSNVNPPVTLPDGRKVVFTSRSPMKVGRPKFKYRAPAAWPIPPVPIDWSKDGKLAFPMLGNDQYGDCMYVAACHADQTFTGNWGVESTFDLATVVRCYKQLSGGDNGLDEGTLVPAWTKGLVNDPKVAILDALEIDTTVPERVRSAIYLYGGVFFMLAVPNKFINNSSTGSIWDAPARPNEMNGHGVWWNGVDEKGNYRLQTWGTYVWITPAGVESCDPSGFVVFSLRWFDPATGLAANGMTYDQLADLWVQAGGKTLPPSPFPNPLPPSPKP